MSTQTEEPQEPKPAATGLVFDRERPSPAARDALTEILGRLDGQPEPDEAEVVATGREPVLTVPEALTPLPAVDQATATFALFGGVIRGKRARYRIGVLKTLQSERSWR